MRKLSTLFIIPAILFISNANLTAQIVNIPDANFKAALVANAAININLDAEIQTSEANFYTGGIFVGTQGINDLTGIEAFWNINTLDVSQNNLTSVNLTSNGLLQSFNCGFNSLTCLDLGSNFQLTSLDCSNNSLLKLNMKNGNNTNVVSIDYSGNPLLGCVQVDNPSFCTASWPVLPGSAYFSADCGIPVANFTSTSPVCLGDSIQFTNLSTNAVSYNWAFGDGAYSPLTNPSHTYLLPSGYTCTLTAYSSCYGSAIYSWNQYVYATNITGAVTYSGGPVSSGTVILLDHEPFFTSYDTVATTNLNAAGQYTFVNAPGGDFLIKVYPDTTLYPDLIPTYKDNVWAWDSANVFIHGCTQEDTANISMYELSPISGPGSLSGLVKEADGFGRAQGDPIHGVDVKLGITGSNMIVANTETDTSGTYTFGNLPYGSYTIYVDIPGLNRDSTYQKILDAVNPTYTNLNYWVDSNSVYIIENIGIEELPENVLQYGLFPNPTNDNTTVIYTLESDANIQLEIYNLLGIKMQTIVNEEQGPGDYIYTFNPKSSNMQPGIYFMRLSSGNKSKTLRVMVVD